MFTMMIRAVSKSRSIFQTFTLLFTGSSFDMREYGSQTSTLLYRDDLRHPPAEWRRVSERFQRLAVCADSTHATAARRGSRGCGTQGMPVCRFFSSLRWKDRARNALAASLISLKTFDFLSNRVSRNSAIVLSNRVLSNRVYRNSAIVIQSYLMRVFHCLSLYLFSIVSLSICHFFFECF